MFYHQLGTGLVLLFIIDSYWFHQSFRALVAGVGNGMYAVAANR